MINTDILYNIMLHSHVFDVFSLSQTHKKAYKLCKEKHLWKNKCHQDYPITYQTQNWIHEYKKIYEAHKWAINETKRLIQSKFFYYTSVKINGKPVNICELTMLPKEITNYIKDKTIAEMKLEGTYYNFINIYILTIDKYEIRKKFVLVTEEMIDMFSRMYYELPYIKFVNIMEQID